MPGGGGDFDVKWVGGVDGRFEEVVIRAELWRKGQDLDLDMEVVELTVEPQGIVDVWVDESRTTPDTAYLRADLSRDILDDEDFFEKVKEPVRVRMVARPVASATASLILAESPDVERRFTVGVQVPEARIHWRDIEHPELGDDPILEVEADGDDDLQLEVWLERYVPAKRAVVRDETVHFSHKTGPMFRPRIFGAHPESLPWEVAQPGSNNRRDRSRWKSNAALPDSRHTEQVPLHGHIRVRAWGPKDITGRRPNEIAVPHSEGHLAEHNVPVHLVPVKVGVRKIEPKEPVPADDAPSAVELELYRIRTGEPLKRGEVSWKLREGARYPGGSFDVETKTLVPEDNGRVRFSYTVPRLLYEPGKAWDQDVDVHLGAGEKKQKLDGVVLFVSPELRATLSAEKSGLTFDPPTQVIVAAHRTPCELVGHCGFASKSPLLPDRVDVNDAKPILKVTCESGEVDVALDVRTASDGTFTWHLPELAPGLEGLPDSRRKVKLEPFTEGAVADLDERGRELTKQLVAYIGSGQSGVVLGRLLGSAEQDAVNRQPMVMARHLSENVETVWPKAHHGTRIVEHDLRGAVLVDAVHAALFEQALDLIVKFLFDAIEALVEFSKAGERLLAYIANSRIGSRLGSLAIRFANWTASKLQSLLPRLGRAFPSLAGTIDRFLMALGEGHLDSAALRGLVAEVQAKIAHTVISLVDAVRRRALDVVFHEALPPLVREAFGTGGAKSLEKVLDVAVKYAQKKLSEAGTTDLDYQQMKRELRAELSSVDDTVREVTRSTAAAVGQFGFPDDPGSLVRYLHKLSQEENSNVDLAHAITGVDDLVSTIDDLVDVLTVIAVVGTVLSGFSAAPITLPFIAALGVPKIIGKLVIHFFQGIILLIYASALEELYRKETMRLTNPEWIG